MKMNIWMIWEMRRTGKATNAMMKTMIMMIMWIYRMNEDFCFMHSFKRRKAHQGHRPLGALRRKAHLKRGLFVK